MDRAAGLPGQMGTLPGACWKTVAELESLQVRLTRLADDLSAVGLDKAAARVEKARLQARQASAELAQAVDGQ